MKKKIVWGAFKNSPTDMKTLKTFSKGIAVERKSRISDLLGVHN